LTKEQPTMDIQQDKSGNKIANVIISFTYEQYYALAENLQLNAQQRSVPR